MGPHAPASQVSPKHQLGEIGLERLVLTYVQTAYERGSD